MRSIYVISMLLMMSVPALSQTADEKSYFDEIFRKSQATHLPKGAKYKIISYADKGYEISGKFLKSIPVDSTMIKITDTRNNLTLSGQYIHIDGKSAVHGRLDYLHNGKQVSSYGKFIVNNGADVLVMKPKKASDLSITEVQVDIWVGYWKNYPCILKKMPYWYFLSIDASTGGWYYSELSAKISYTDVEEAFGYEDIGGLLMMPLQVDISYADGIKFLGRAIGKSSMDGDIEYTLLDGEKSGMPKAQTIELKSCTDSVVSEKYVLTIRTPESSEIIEESFSLPSSMKYIDLDSLWIKSYYLKYSPSISIKYKNGDGYSGKFVIKDGNAVITDGIYLYKNGDKFEGDLSGEYFGTIPVTGKTIFKDGTVKEGNWLKEYALTANQFKAISDKKYAPSDIREIAVSYVNENNFNRLVEEAEKYESNGDFERAKSLYREALDHKNNTGISYRIEFLDKKIERQKLAQKYGNRYADNIMNGIIETGMTKEMCELVLSKAVGMEFYRVSSWTNFVGEQMETWEFDYDYGIEKENQQRLKEDIENNDKSAFLVYGFMNAIGDLTSGAASNMAKYKYLKFRNSVLIELKDSSFYDDVNKAQREAEDALNSLYWLFGE